MATSNVSITDEQHAMVREAVELGFYANASEVHRAALRDWQLKFEKHKAQLEAIKSAALEAIGEVESGALSTNEEIDARIEARINALFSDK